MAILSLESLSPARPDYSGYNPALAIDMPIFSPTGWQIPVETAPAQCACIELSLAQP